ncbi:MAG: C4-dicarboxylate ABC transporter [Hydrogenophilales bacterium CG03_land_8_20_14_0_80_62_28]|nr:MAG: C4-dicarboxylate ABC transporter [Hydrogenophilales bacterium CG03_land_8_20_14_0_80_62_28]PIW71478.1 MAG: C4-dicarboxylate ABC transporter [Hydrogenophilales bacterium CG12_big_fil_rev_8_21_14_0_65_61_21]PIY97778.1 MAG: C4-dicarboxylate ABC transporter [Hydrogenophilales bacterium CG_4_10_14_0_8_um_filter_62_70]
MQRLKSFSISWFAMVMGLSGLAIAWERAEEILHLPFHPSPALLVFATLTFVVLTGLYGAKMLKYREAVRKEWAHPIKMNFIPTFSIALILLAIAWQPFNAAYSQWLWIVGSAVQLLLTLYIVSWWVHHTQFEIVHLNPAWFIPVVGNMLVPIVGIQFAPNEVSWFFFGLGLMFWPILLAIVFYRIVFHGSLPERLLPTLFILIAPPAVGFVSYVKLTGSVDAFAQVLYNGGLFFTLLLFFQAKWFTRLKFFLSWWAYSFPLAAIAIASLVMVQHTGSLIYLRLSGVLLGIASVVIASLLVRTAIAVSRKEICVED